MKQKLPEAFPPALVRFVEHFNDGAYWESHEILEAPWRANRSPFYKGLIIYASAFVHAQRGNPVGVGKQLRKARRYLSAYAPSYLGVDVGRLLHELAQSLAAAERYTGPRGPEFARPFPYRRLDLDPALLQGREPELGRG